jgi:hypothetical protein
MPPFFMDVFDMSLSEILSAAGLKMITNNDLFSVTE